MTRFNVKSVLAMQNYFNNIEHSIPIVNERNLRTMFENYDVVERTYLNPWLNPLKILHSFLTGFGFSAIYNNVMYVLRKR